MTTRRMSRNMRKLRAYATNDGQGPVVKRPLSDIAPTVKGARTVAKRPRTPSTAPALAAAPSAGLKLQRTHGAGPSRAVPSTAGAASEDDAIHPAVVAYVRERCTQAPSRLKKTQATVVAALTRDLRREVENGDASGSAVGKVAEAHVTRVNLGSHGAKAVPSPAGGAEHADVWNAICFSALQRAAVAAPEVARPALLVVTPGDAEARLLATYAKEVFGMHNVVVVRASCVTQPKPEPPSTEDARLASAELYVATVPGILADTGSRRVAWSRVGAYVLSHVAAASGRDQGPALRKWLTAHLPQVRDVVVVEETLAALSDPQLEWMLPTATCAAAAAVVRQPAVIRYAVVEGTSRFQFLLSLLQGLRRGCGLVVHFATKEACKFTHDVLYALECIPNDVKVFCDYSGCSEYSSVKDEADMRALCAAFDGFMTAADGKLEGETRGLFLSAYGLTPSMGTTFLQYDVMADVANFTQFVADRLMGSSPASGSPYRHVIVLFHRNEVTEGCKFLEAPAKRLSITVEPLGTMPSATRNLLTVQKLQSLNKKLFAIQNGAYEAYRATMMLYSHLQPKSVYNVGDVSLEHVAAQFGYSEPPLLDLRTKTTPFRPKEDLFKAARQRQKHDRRALRKYAEKSIVGEKAEDHMASSWDTS